MTDYCTTPQVRRQLITEQTRDDDLIEECIVAASDFIDRYTGTRFGVTEDTVRYFRRDRIVGRKLVFDKPLAALPTTVLNADGSTIGAGAYTVEPLNWQGDGKPIEAIQLSRSSHLFWRFLHCTDEDYISVTGKWGYSTAIPPLVNRSCVRVATFYYKLRELGVLDVIAVPEAGIIQMPKGFPKEVVIMLRRFVQRRMAVL